MPLIVNTASKRGFTPQYEGLEALYRELKATSGFAVLGFPATSSGAQEPGIGDRDRELLLADHFTT